MLNLERIDIEINLSKDTIVIFWKKIYCPIQLLALIQNLRFWKWNLQNYEGGHAITFI